MIPNSQRTPEQRRKNARKAGIASGRARRRKKTMREAAELYLSLPVADRNRADDIAGRDVSANDINNQMAMIIGLVDAATDGDARAAKIIIDLVGGMEPEKSDNDTNKNGVIEIPAVDMTEFEKLKQQELEKMEAAERE